MSNDLSKEEHGITDDTTKVAKYLKYKVRIITITDYLTDSQKDAVFILKEFEDEDCLIPSRLTAYLRTRYSGHSLNSQKKKAEMIVQFLNYIIDEIALGYNETFDIVKEKGLYGLNFYHLAEYINSLRDVNSYATVKKKEHLLIDFYEYLHQLRITGEEAKVERVPTPIKNTKYIKNEVVWQNVNPFTGNANYMIEYPDSEKVRREILKDMEDELWNTFVDYAKEYYPNIAFGVLLQICSGIRTGELVNLTLDSIERHKEKNYLELSIQDRQRQLFDRDVDVRHSQCKKPREGQPAFNFNGQLFDMLDEHIKRLKDNPRRKNKSALFIDSHGQPMTGQAYQRQFHKLKWDFIKFIEEHKPSIAEELTVKVWGSHIGRHIFTNHLIRHGYLKNIMGYSDPKLLMILRGDSSVKSAEVYLDLKNITESVADQIEIISTIAVQITPKGR